MRKFSAYLLILSISACTAAQKDRTTASEKGAPLMAVSWYYPNNDYQRWIHSSDSSWNFVELYEQAFKDLDSVLEASSGLILTGGSDIAPDRYGERDSLGRCGAPNLRRDSFELYAYRKAKELRLPILAICRGMQIMNVAEGGDLYVDLPTQQQTFLHQKKDSDAVHTVFFEDDRFKRFFGRDSLITNSNHHQAIQTVGNDLVVAAVARDSVFEAVYHRNRKEFPFLIGVQWHPERMDRQAPGASPLLDSFLVQSISFFHGMD